MVAAFLRERMLGRNCRVGIVPLYEPVGTADTLEATPCACGKSCRRAGKHPRIDGWNNREKPRATLNSRVIERWWTRSPGANIGVVGLVGLDVDQRSGGNLDGLPDTVRVRTGDGWHCWFAPPGFEVQHADLRPGVVVRGAGELFVGPGSRHWSGATYMIENPGAALAAWPFPKPPSPPPWPCAAAETAVRPIPVGRQAAYGAAVVHGEIGRVHAAIPNENRNQSVYVAARRVAGRAEACGIDLEQAASQLRVASLATGLTVAEVDRAIANGFRNGLRQPRPIPDRARPSHPPGHPRTATRAARDAIAAQVWPGRSGPYRQRVVQAGLEVAMRAQGSEFDLGVRELAERAEVSKSTAASHLAWAVRAGFFTVVDVSTVTRREDGKPPIVRVVGANHARRFTLGPKALGAARALLGHTKTEPLYPAPPKRGDAFRRSFQGQRGLGAHRGRYLGLLQTRPWTVLELAATFAVSVGQVRRHLRELQQAGLAMCVGGELWMAGPRDPEDVAVELGLAGVTARQQVQHRRDRRGWTAWLAERAREAKQQRDRLRVRLRSCQQRKQRPAPPPRRWRPKMPCPKQSGTMWPPRDVLDPGQDVGREPDDEAVHPRLVVTVEPEPCEWDLAWGAEQEAVEAAWQEAGELRAWQAA